MKQYTREVTCCRNCPNVLRWGLTPEIYRCKAKTHRKHNYRIIHQENWNEAFPEWCPLKEIELIPLPF